MKYYRKTPLLLLAPLIVGAVGYTAWKQFPGSPTQGQGRKVVCYQDSMHPWIKSDRPGKCTVCAMDLTPIYEGAQGFEVSDKTIVLSSNSITVLNVQTETVQQQSLRRSVRVAGTLEATETGKRVITAGKAGRIERLAVPYVGFEVAEGERLANFFIPELLAEARRYAMLARTGPRAGQEHEAGLSNPLLSTLQNLRLFGLTETQIENLATAGKVEGSFELLSPLTGTVIERNVSEGQYVSEGTRIFTIVDLSVLWFRFDAYEQDLPWLQVGQQVGISVPTAPGQVFSGPITFIEPFVNETTRTAKVRVDVANPVVEINGVKQRALRHQLYAEGQVRVETPARLVIPSTAVLSPGEQAYAYVDTGGGAYEVRQLKLGRRGDRYWEVLGGLDAGENVVTTGNVLLDAQAQFNRSGDGGEANPRELAAAPADAGHQPTIGNAAILQNPGLSQPQQKALQDFLAAANGVSQALAADRLDQLKPHIGALPALAALVEKELGAEHAWQPLLRRIQSAARWGEPPSLPAAREAFLPFSTNVVELVQQIRAHEAGFRTLKVYHCPMAPKPGLWFQAQGPLRNPYYGAEMLSCGNEVKLPAAVVEEPAQTLARTSPPVTSSTPPTPHSLALPTPSASPAPHRAVTATRQAQPAADRLSSFSEAQNLNSRDHSAYENRLKDALSARFASLGQPGTNASRPSMTRMSARPVATQIHQAPTAHR